MSLAKNLHLLVWEQQVTPWILGLEHIAIAKYSIAIAKIKGDSGQLCLVPLAILGF